MSAAALLEGLHRQGVRLWLEGDELRLRGSKRVLTPETLACLKEQKPEIVALLQSPPSHEECFGQDRCPHEVPGGCWLCKKYGRPELARPTVEGVLANPPRWLSCYIAGYNRGRIGLVVLSGAVAAAMGLSPFEWAEELEPEVLASIRPLAVVA